MIKESAMPNINNPENKSPVEDAGFINKKNKDDKNEKPNSSNSLRKLIEKESNQKVRDSFLEYLDEFGEERLKKLLVSQDFHNVCNIGAKINKELSNRLFDVYLEIIDNAEKGTDGLAKMYNDIFFEKSIDRNKAKNLFFRKASKLLQDASLEIKNII